MSIFLFIRRPPASELGFARGPFPLTLLPETRISIALPTEGLIQREAAATAPEVSGGPGLSAGAANVVAGAINLITGIIGSVARAVVVQAAGPAAPVVGRVLPAFRIPQVSPSSLVTPVSTTSEEVAESAPELDVLDVVTPESIEIAQATEALGYDPRTAREPIGE